MGLKGSNTVPLTLENVRVPERYRVGDEGIGFRIAMDALDGERIGIGSQALGIGRAALAEAAPSWKNGSLESRSIGTRRCSS